MEGEIGGIERACRRIAGVIAMDVPEVIAIEEHVLADDVLGVVHNFRLVPGIECEIAPGAVPEAAVGKAAVVGRGEVELDRAGIIPGVVSRGV